MSTAALTRELEAALTDTERFEALALVDLNRDTLLFLQTIPQAPAGLDAALEAFLLRLVTHTEAHDQFKTNDEIVFYDLDDRQLVSLYFEAGPRRAVLVAVVAPQKAYKQVIRRLAKTLKTLI